MALVTRRNPVTDELESYWDPHIKIRKAISDDAFEAGQKLRKYAVEYRVTMYDIAKELGVSSLDVSDTFRGLHEITPEMDSQYRGAIKRVADINDGSTIGERAWISK